MKQKIKYVAGPLLVLTIVTAPLSASAASIADLQAQIAQLLPVVAQLQQKITARNAARAAAKKAPLALVNFTGTDAEEEGYWYSRYNLGNLVMRSGMGASVIPDKAKIMKALAAVDADFNPAQMMTKNLKYGDGDHPMPPMNPALIKTVYKGGDSHYIRKFNPDNFFTQRWDEAKMDTSLTGVANGYTILKEVEWARQFHVDEHFGTPKSDFGAYWRFVGMMMSMNAKMQAKS